MGFWAKLFGREVDTTVTDYQAEVAGAPRPAEPEVPARVGSSIGGTFRFTIEDVFVIQGRGTVVTGRIELGTVTVGDVVEWNGPDGQVRSAQVTALEAFRQKLDTAGVGDMVGLLIGDVARADLPIGTVLSRP